MATKPKGQKQPPLPKTFEKLVKMIPPMAIRDDVQHANVVEVIDRLMQIARLSREQSDYLETLVELTEAYEARRHAINVSRMSGIQMLKHVLGESGMSASDLARMLGTHATLGSKILKGERRLTWQHAKLLGAQFKVAPMLFMD